MYQSPNLRIVLVEDNLGLRADMKAMLGRNPIASLVGETGYVEEAVELIPALMPDLVLLDIQLVGGTCFDILEKLRPIQFKTIFITGYETYAIKAIKYGALDYIVKPFDPEELDNALLRARQMTPMAEQQLQTVAAGIRHSEIDPIVAVNDGSIWHVINLFEVSHAQSGEDTTIYLADGSTVDTSKTITELYNVWPTDTFIRPHAAYLVNKRQVKSYNSKKQELVLKSGIVVPVAPKRKETVMSFLLNR